MYILWPHLCLQLILISDLYLTSHPSSHLLFNISPLIPHHPSVQILFYCFPCSPYPRFVVSVPIKPLPLQLRQTTLISFSSGILTQGLILAHDSNQQLQWPMTPISNCRKSLTLWLPPWLLSTKEITLLGEVVLHYRPTVNLITTD